MQHAQQRSVDPIRMKSTVEALISRDSVEKGGSQRLPELVHDARNMVTALALYCDLLEEPGVLTVKSRHYARELRLVAAASRKLVENMSRVGDRSRTGDGNVDWQHRVFPVLAAALPGTANPRPSAPASSSLVRAAVLGGVRNLAMELSDNLNLLQAVAGAAVPVHLAVHGGACAVAVSAEDLTRLFVNLVRNAAQPMQGGGTIDITVSERRCEGVPQVLLVVEDSGPGIPASDLERVFEPGFGTDAEATRANSVSKRGLGLSVVRSIVEAAGGRIVARSSEQGGSRFELELPLAH